MRLDPRDAVCLSALKRSSSEISARPANPFDAACTRRVSAARLAPTDEGFLRQREYILNLMDNLQANGLNSPTSARYAMIRFSGANTNAVLRARDAQKLAQAKRAVEDMLERVRRAQSNTA
jgi:hypothetical protein